jgi:hypothetical protein
MLNLPFEFGFNLQGQPRPLERIEQPQVPARARIFNRIRIRCLPYETGITTLQLARIGFGRVSRAKLAMLWAGSMSVTLRGVEALKSLNLKCGSWGADADGGRQSEGESSGESTVGL